MIALDYTFENPNANLAFDEVLLRDAERESSDDVLRFWESTTPFVVLGLTQRINDVVYVDRCTDDAIPITRRCSAGGCVLQGPGCLNFTLILAKNRHPQIISIQNSYDYILNRIIDALPEYDLNRAGISDIALGDLKVSGNAQRRHKNYILHHGTILYDTDIQQVSRYLKEPKDRPDYRGTRSHEKFVSNLATSRESLMETIRTIFECEAATNSPRRDILKEAAELAQTKYDKQAWIYRK